MDILIKTVQVVLALSLLVLVHECGHFIFARLFRIRVDKFYLFFNLFFSLVRCKKINGRWQFRFFARNVPDKYQKVKDLYGEIVKDEKGKPVIEEIPLEDFPVDDWRREQEHTEYGVGWLPIGGYCRIVGMIDESLDKEAMKKEPQPWEFRSKPAGQRFFVMFGGILFNLILAIVIYSGLLYVHGEQYILAQDALYGMECNELAQEVGFRSGDIVLAFDRQPVGKVNELQLDLIYAKPKVITVLRQGDTISFPFDEQFIPSLIKARKLLFQLRFPFVIQEVPDTSANYAAGMLPGDRLLTLNNASAATVQEAQALLGRYAGESVTAQFFRNGDTVSLALQVNKQGFIGVVLDTDPTHFFRFHKKEYALFASIPAGVMKAYHTVANYLKDLGLIFSPKTQAYKSVGSFIAIGSIFPASWDWSVFWSITAFLSIMLAVLNMLPIPALDGGHILFVLFEMITGRKPGDKFLEYAQMTGMIILLAIMCLAFGNDIFRLFH